MLIRFLIPIALLLLTACASPAVQSPAPRQAMVVTANPQASAAGVAVLSAGGSAVDAAVAIQSVLSLVEPQSSGLGGGGYMVYYHQASKVVSVYDGRETAPAAIQAKQFLNQQGESIGYINAKNSGLSIGVPGMVALLALAHQDHGRLPWSELFERASQLANQGFAVSPRLADMLTRFARFIPQQRSDGPLDAYHYFHHSDGQPLAAGDILKNPAYATTLTQIAQDPQTFYQGAIAEQIVEQVALEPRAGSLRLDDLANYQASKKSALCMQYKTMQLCGPPPSSSWLAVAATMGILEHREKFSEAGAQDPKNWQLLAEAQRLAYADRDKYVADEEFVSVPIQGLLHSEYLYRRAQLIDRQHAMTNVSAGDPWAYQTVPEVAHGDDLTNDVAGTSHFVVVDYQGNVVSMTASVESIFGSTRMAGGMFLNNQLTDFSFHPKDANGQLIANRIEPNKRPRSSMSPTIVLDNNNDFVMATGSPGGNSIIAYTVKSLVGVLEWGLSPQQAVSLPNLVARQDVVRIEQSRASNALIQGLYDYGFNVKESKGENSGLSVIHRNANGKLLGGADPRREGIVSMLK